MDIITEMMGFRHRWKIEIHSLFFLPPGLVTLLLGGGQVGEVLFDLVGAETVRI